MIKSIEVLPRVAASVTPPQAMVSILVIHGLLLLIMVLLQLVLVLLVLAVVVLLLLLLQMEMPALPRVASVLLLHRIVVVVVVVVGVACLAQEGDHGR